MDRKTVLITGGSRGIGREFADIFARKNYNLILIADTCDEQELHQTVKKIQQKYPIDIIEIAQNLAIEDAPKKIFNQLHDTQVDILINNAGFGYHAAFLGSDWEYQKKLINTNITALMQMTYLLGQDMKKRGRGKILNIASIAADLPGPYMATYYASKAFVLSFSYALSEELIGSGVKISTLCPGPTKTGFEKTARMKHSRMFRPVPPASPRSVARLGYIMLSFGLRLNFHGLQTKLYNLVLRILPRVVTAKIAKFVDNKPN